MATDLAIDGGLLRVPRGFAEWGVTSISTGFVLLALSLALSWRHARRGHDTPC
jgi:hypothetical protein